MFIYIARHAWAGHYGDPGWPDDSLRPLTPDGIERYQRVVEQLSGRGFAPERIVSSPYVRCAQTAELIADGIGAAVEVDYLEDLAPGARLEPLLDWTARADADSVCWVGHNPDVERLTSQLIGDGFLGIRFAKGSVAAVRFDGSPPEPGEGTLVWHATAKLLGV